MATPRSSIRLVRPLTVLVLAVGTLGAFPTTSHAAPQPAPRPSTSADARDQLTQIGQQAEIVAEQLNSARVTLARRAAEYRIATRQASQIQQQYQALGGQVKRVVSAAYMNVPFGQFTMMLTSRSPSDFVDQLSTLRLLASKRNALLVTVSHVRTEALRAQARAQAALSAQQKLTQQIAAKKADLARRKVALDGILQQLTAQELSSSPADRASRSIVRQPVTGPVSVGPASGAAQTAVSVALAQRGKPYSWGGAGPDAYDCSGLVMYAWGAAGVSLPHSAEAQYGYGVHISRGEVRAGDLVFFYSPIHHVGIAISNTMLVHAPTFGEPVQVASIDSMPYVGATRLG